MPAKSEIAAAARGLMRRAFKGSLATIDARNGYPYASLITLATDASGAPTFLISKLARHTANLAQRPARLDHGRRDRRARRSAAGRARHRSTARPSRTPEAGREAALSRPAPGSRLLCRLPGFRVLAARRSRAPIISAASAASSISRRTSCWFRSMAPTSLVEAEPGIVEHMNEDHADARRALRHRPCRRRAGALAHDRHRSRGLRHRPRRRRRGASCSPSRSPPRPKRARSWSGSPPRPAPGGNSRLAAAVSAVP